MSLALAIELGGLWAGVALPRGLRSWQPALMERVEVEDQGHFGEVGRVVTTDDLLHRTVFYKVGHHGSHNATLKDALEKMAKENELVAFIPVDRGMRSRGIPRQLCMPARALYRRLLEKCQASGPGADLGWAEDAAVAQDKKTEQELGGLATVSEWKAWKLNQTRASASVDPGKNDLYVDYVLGRERARPRSGRRSHPFAVRLGLSGASIAPTGRWAWSARPIDHDSTSAKFAAGVDDLHDERIVGDPPLRCLLTADMSVSASLPILEPCWTMDLCGSIEKSRASRSVFRGHRRYKPG